MVLTNLRPEQKGRARIVAALLAAAAAVLLLPAASRAQAKKSITREGLVKAVRINGLSTAELVQQVQSRGVSFRMTPDAEAELRAAGARPEVIATARANYRAAPAVAGGGGRRPTAGSSRPARGGPDYDDLTDQATAAYDARDASRATQLLRQAIQLSPQQPRAYQLLGFTQLYLQSNIAEAEANMRRAIELGGSASFRVFHDHVDGTFKQTCAGTLFITRTNVTFRADDGRDTFEVADGLIKEIKTNKVSGGAFGVLLGGKNIGAFHIKVRFGGDSKNYNFAPLTNKKAESELIITLVKAHGGVQ
jgi:tetratricopeptide (TPR) repeat protein